MASLPKASTSKVYLAGKFERAPELRTIRQRLRQLGLTVTSRWLDLDLTGRPTPDDPEWLIWARRCAEEDLLDINQADTFMLDTTDVRSGGGSHFETGYAYSRGTPVFLIGPRTNVFH